MAINLIGFGVLLAATILCATTARLAMLEQQNSKDSRMLKWFLLLGTVWYLVLTLQYLFPAVELLAHKRGAVLPIGVMRPFLLIFIAGLSHCYSEQLPKESRFRLPVWMIYLPSVVVVSVFAAVRIGTARMFGRLPFRIESEPIIFLCFAIILYNLLIVLVCYLQITKTSERSKVWFILFSLEILLLLRSFNFWPEAIVNVRNFYDLASLLLPLPLALWLAYSRARYLFFDLLIKKTLSAILLSVFIFASISAGFFLIQVRGGSTE
ncbi:MAG: hypothetical protein JNN15_03055, partial [Blastocatellia bacterium]|nr:hypothetical protein [Blastocatellia bacterium]